MNKLYEENDIQAIANAIRGKNGSTDTYKVSEMASAIDGIPSGGNLEDYIPEEAFHFSGNLSYRFAYQTWDWFLKEYGNRITTSDISEANRMFYTSHLKEIPFDLNFVEGGCTTSNIFGYCTKLKSVPSIDFKQTSVKDCSSMFAYGYEIEEIGEISNLFPSNIQYLFQHCNNLRYLPKFKNLNLSYVQTDTSARNNALFTHCYSLREIPEEFLEQIYGAFQSTAGVQFVQMFRCNYVLDRIIGLNPQTSTFNSLMFSSTFEECSRVEDIIFKTQENGEPYSANWKGQTINLSNYVGYASGRSVVTGYNSGITEDKRVTGDATYQALKNDPDWFTLNVNYSRYNHDSAVNTINSLPDTSAYLTSNGGTNTIKFNGESGKLTDGGAINTLTEAEIAVATAKGWTVTFA